MPELPEVDTVRQGLAPHLEGARLVRVAQYRPDLRFPFPERFAERLTGATVQSLGRRAKYLVAGLDTGESLVAHLGMTGRFLIGETTSGRFHNASGGLEKHTHLAMETDQGRLIAFNDARRFGYMGLIETAKLPSHPWFAGLGPEPLGDEFNVAALSAALKGKSQNIKASLLDQRTVAGLGNIYVSEALHRARIDPRRAAGELSNKEIERLTRDVKTILEAAIVAGGSTLRDFRNATGELGYFQHSFNAYDREGLVCTTSRCKGQIERIVQGGRSTFFCSRCQV